jgi:hypothetical protein
MNGNDTHQFKLRTYHGGKVDIDHSSRPSIIPHIFSKSGISTSENEYTSSITGRKDRHACCRRWWVATGRVVRLVLLMELLLRLVLMLKLRMLCCGSNVVVMKRGLGRGSRSLCGKKNGIEQVSQTLVTLIPFTCANNDVKIESWNGSRNAYT